MFASQQGLNSTAKCVQKQVQVTMNQLTFKQATDMGMLEMDTTATMNALMDMLVMPMIEAVKATILMDTIRMVLE